MSHPTENRRWSVSFGSVDRAEGSRAALTARPTYGWLDVLVTLALGIGVVLTPL